MSEDKHTQGLHEFPVAGDSAAPSPPQARLVIRVVGWVLLVLLAAITIWIVDRKADKDQPRRPPPRSLTAHAGLA
ncbi:MAG: hypothetical protein HKL95_03945, partial [Phycisphaerae bacterium]|nr:hypothetical protein [Phycisphaerae bacterium]